MDAHPQFVLAPTALRANCPSQIAGEDAGSGRGPNFSATMQRSGGESLRVDEDDLL
jgi:hypothetical protein